MTVTGSCGGVISGDDGFYQLTR